MTIILPALAVAFAAFCIWLGMRIVNRRERWAKRALAALIGVPVLYVVSFGPACWWFSAWHHGTNKGFPICPTADSLLAVRSSDERRAISNR